MRSSVADGLYVGASPRASRPHRRFSSQPACLSQQAIARPSTSLACVIHTPSRVGRVVASQQFGTENRSVPDNDRSGLAGHGPGNEHRAGDGHSGYRPVAPDARALRRAPDYVQSIAGYVRSRPAPPVNAFRSQSDTALAHDAQAQPGRIQAPTLIMFGRHDPITSTRFAQPLQAGIAGSEVIIFEGSAHAPIYEQVDEFSQQTLEFLQKHMGS